MTKNRFRGFSLKGIEDHPAISSLMDLHICGLRGIQGSAAHQESLFARSLMGAKDDPLDFLDPVGTEKAKLRPGFRIGQER